MADQLPSTIQEFNQFNVNRAGWEKIAWEFYDRQTYIAAGQAQLNFFQAGPAGTNLSQTDMQLPGQLPINQVFLLQGIEVTFDPTTPTVAADMPAAFGAQAVANIINDAYIFYRSGNLQLFIGSKPYLQVAPLGRFPSQRNFHVEGALADVSTAGAALQSRIAFGHSVGRPFTLNPFLLLTSNQNFGVNLNWPEGVQAITNPAQVFVHLCGTIVRRSQ